MEKKYYCRIFDEFNKYLYLIKERVCDNIIEEQLEIHEILDNGITGIDVIYKQDIFEIEPRPGRYEITPQLYNRIVEIYDDYVVWLEDKKEVLLNKYSNTFKNFQHYPTELIVNNSLPVLAISDNGITITGITTKPKDLNYTTSIRATFSPLYIIDHNHTNIGLLYGVVDLYNFKYALITQEEYEEIENRYKNFSYEIRKEIRVFFNKKNTQETLKSNN